MLKEISIEIIRKCPNKCVHCSSLSCDSSTEMLTLEKFKEVVEGVKKLGLKTICFSGGEPFLHPEITEMVEYVHNIGLCCYVYSSGIYMDSLKERSAIPERILHSIKGKVSKIIFNIEAVDERTYNKVMGTTGCMPFLEESIKSAVDKNIIVEGHFVPMKLNKDCIEDVVKFCERLGVSKISYLRLVLHGRAFNNRTEIELSEQERKSVEERIIQLHKDKSSCVRVGVPILGETKGVHCEAANGKLNIKYDGNVYPCEVFKNQRLEVLAKYKPDNILEKSIEEIYYNSTYLQKVRELVENFSCENCCEKCVGQYYINAKMQEDKNG